MKRLLPCTLALVCASLLVASVASADSPEVQTPEADPPPPPPAPSTVQAGVVNTNHVDTVLVAQPGSKVDFHQDSSSSDDGDHPRYARDNGRTAALLASSIVWGIGGSVSGLAYVIEHNTQSCSYNSNSSYGGGSQGCTRNQGTASLVMYDSIMTFVPSIPRWVVGDTSGALLYTAVRGASVLIGTLPDYAGAQDAWIGPFALGFLVPFTLGMVDLATTPQREDLRPRADHPSSAANGPHLLGITPVALTDASHRTSGAALQLAASF